MPVQQPNSLCMQSLLPAVAAVCAQLADAVRNPKIVNVSRNKKNVVLRATFNFRCEMNTCCPVCSDVRAAFFPAFMFSYPTPCATHRCHRPQYLNRGNRQHLSTVNDSSKCR